MIRLRVSGWVRRSGPIFPDCRDRPRGVCAGLCMEKQRGTSEFDCIVCHALGPAEVDESSSPRPSPRFLWRKGSLMMPALG